MRYVRAVPRKDLDALVAAAQDGDLGAFEALLAGHLPAVRRFARAFARSDADADDLAQEALLRVFRNLRLFRYQAAFSTWLYSVVRNAFLDAGKGREGRRRALEEPLGREHEDHEGGERPDTAALGEEERRRVWEALRRIPVEFRTAVVLFDLEGHTYDEVAAVEGVAVGTVKSRLHRGRAALRALLVEAGEPTSEAPGTSGAAPSSNLSRDS
jgi:RNA polymerase sigma-70 factor (ECF subfamily)